MTCKEVTYHGGMEEENITKEEISRLTNIIEKRGNIPVYEYTKFQLEKQYQFKELLPIAKLMSDKHHHEKASYDVYLTYKNINGFELSDLTKSEQKNALEYLLKAYENGNQNAKSDLEKYWMKEIFIVKDSLLDVISAKSIYFSDTKVVLKEVPDGTIILKKSVPGAYAGMLVKPFKNKSENKDQQ